MSATRSVLVVDDDVQLLRLLVRLLEGAGHRVRTATRSDEALACLAEETSDIDLVLLDVNLAPAAGAAELLPRIDSLRPGLELLLMSGDALPESLERMLADRGWRFVRKPFAPKALLQLIERADR